MEMVALFGNVKNLLKWATRIWSLAAAKLWPRRLYYINGPETLPPPLPALEEGNCLKRLEEGGAAAEAAKSELIVHNLRLVVYIAKKFENTGIGVEDLVSIGTIGLIKAVNTFCPLRNIKLATYASRCIENEILMYLRKSANLKNEVSIDEPLNIDWDGNELLLSDVLGTENDVIHQDIEKDVEKSLLEGAISHLSKRERTIMEMRFGLCDGIERTQKEVADTLGISQSYISRLEKRIILHLRKEIERVS
jgi:RNA polymerase sporulation-specific sigma factor